MKKIQVVFIKASGSFKRGDQSEIEADKFQSGVDAGMFVSADAWTQIKARETEGLNMIVRAIDKLKVAEAIAPKDETVLASAKTRFEAGTPAEVLVELIEATHKPKVAAAVATRQTDGQDGTKISAVSTGEAGFRESVIGYLKASEPFTAARKQGGILAKVKGNLEETNKVGIISMNRAKIMEKIIAMINGGADYNFENIVKAADYVDPNNSNALGTLNTDMLIGFNLGYLESQLAMLDDITTDITNQAVMFNQTALTRYITVPGFQSKTDGTAWRSPNGATVDVNVKMDKYIGVSLSWSENYLGTTTRNLPAEFKAPQLYSIGKAIIYYLVKNAISGNTRVANDGVTTSTILPKAKMDGVNASGIYAGMAAATLSTFIGDLPSAMDLAEMPGGDEDESVTTLQRFAWINTILYSRIASDTNLLLNQTIQGLQSKINPNLLATGKINRLGSISFRKSQLMTDQSSLTSDGGNPAIYTVSSGAPSAATTLGLAGTRSGLIFTSRIPTDYTKVMPEIPSTAAIEVVTSPKLGIQLVVTKFLDHAYETANMRAATMFGTAIGDERQLSLLNK